MKMSDNLTKYEVLIEQQLRSILDISGKRTELLVNKCEYGFLIHYIREEQFSQ